MYNHTEELIKKVDSYLTLMRFEYSAKEQLSRLKILENYYNTLNSKSTVEIIEGKAEIAESLSKDLVLPLKVKGVMLSEGKPKRKYYTAKEMKKAVSNPLNSRFPLMLDHRMNDASSIVGVVESIEFDESLNAIVWYGKINDETFARNVIDGIITQVSATIYSGDKLDDELGIVATDLIFRELSLVVSGADSKASITIA